MVTWRLVLQGADVDGRNLLPPHLKSNQRQHHHLRHQDVVDLCSMDPHLRKPCIGLLLIFLVAHLEKIIFYISVSTIIFVIKMLLTSAAWILI